MSLSDLSAVELSSEEEDNVLCDGGPSRVYRTRMQPLEHYNEQQFRDRYRISKLTLHFLMGLLEPRLKRPMTHRIASISAVEQVLLALNFYASGGFQITVADHIRVHKTTACRIIKRVSKEIAKLRPIFVKMPETDMEQATVRNRFNAIRGFPKVIGAIDCTHIKIQSPGGLNAELFRNRKGYFSLNVQAVCDAELRILDIISRWPGSVHDTTILNDSHLRADFEMGQYGRHVLLGDSGYPCRKYLLTPFIQPNTDSEHRYNNAQIATRNPIERCFGVLKRRFPCLSMGLRVKLDTAMHIIVACAVLHNIALNHNDAADFNEMMAGPAEPVDPPVLSHTIGEWNENFTRSALLVIHFS